LCSSLYHGQLHECELSTSDKIDTFWLTIHIYRDLYRGPSRRLAIHAAEGAVNIAAARTITAASAVLNGTGTIGAWRQAYWAELGARAAARAIRCGFGNFRG
jgi:hypothetical protein